MGGSGLSQEKLQNPKKRDRNQDVEVLLPRNIALQGSVKYLLPPVICSSYSSNLKWDSAPVTDWLYIFMAPG